MSEKQELHGFVWVLLGTTTFLTNLSIYTNQIKAKLIVIDLELILLSAYTHFKLKYPGGYGYQDYQVVKDILIDMDILMDMVIYSGRRLYQYNEDDFRNKLIDLN